MSLKNCIMSNKNEHVPPQKEGKAEEQKLGKEEKKGQKKEKDSKELTALKEQVEELQRKNAELTEKVGAEKNDYLRLMAEFETFRRRTSEERLALVGTAAAETIKGLLPVLDDCERAIEMLKDSSDEAAKTGTSLIYGKLLGYLKTKGLEVIEARGAKFDTDFHEAVAQVPVEEEARKGMVYDVVETGYMLGGKVLRYAKVVVGI